MDGEDEMNNAMSWMLVLFGLVALAAIPAFVFADVVDESHVVGASATVSTYVDTSISPSSLTFGTLDPGATDSAATNNPLALTNTINSNTAIDTYLKSTNLVSGANTIIVGNLSVSKTGSAVGATNLVSTGWLADAGPNQGYYENTARNTSVDLYFWLDIPAGQTAGLYGGNVTIKSVVDGGTP